MLVGAGRSAPHRSNFGKSRLCGPALFRLSGFPAFRFYSPSGGATLVGAPCRQSALAVLRDQARRRTPSITIRPALTGSPKLKTPARPPVPIDVPAGLLPGGAKFRLAGENPVVGPALAGLLTGTDRWTWRGGARATPLSDEASALAAKVPIVAASVFQPLQAATGATSPGLIRPGCGGLATVRQVSSPGGAPPFLARQQTRLSPVLRQACGRETRCRSPCRPRPGIAIEVAMVAARR